MDVNVDFRGTRAAAVTVYQYDYGQALFFGSLYVPDGTEVDFYQMGNNITRSVKSGRVVIPDIMLQQRADITVYVYLREGDSGRTIFKVTISITGRQPPGNNPAEDSKDYKRLVPSGGEIGQVLTKTSNDDYDFSWADASVSEGDYEDITDDDIDALFKTNSSESNVAVESKKNEDIQK